jgi:hypothetical protein
MLRINSETSWFHLQDYRDAQSTEHKIPEALNIDNHLMFMHNHLLGVRCWGVEADLSPPSNAEVQNL